ncbi:MAG: hypothetical protein AAF322_18345 [Pseudomonadota bacterium]
MVRTRREAFGAGVLTLATFLIAPLTAPGPIELANAAGVAVALWAAFLVWRNYGREDVAETFPFRVGPAGPALLITAAAVFVAAIAAGWIAWTGYASSRLQAIDAILVEIWRFPLSPVEVYGSAAPDGPPVSVSDMRLVGATLTVALACGAVFGLVCLVGGVDRRETLRKHAVVWRGWRLESAESRLAARGVKGLQPVRDPIAEAASTRPLSRWAYLRALSLLVAIVCLPFAPLCLKLAATIPIQEVQAFFANPLFANEFFAVWLVGLWGFCIGAAVILFAVYLRLGWALARA